MSSAENGQSNMLKIALKITEKEAMQRYRSNIPVKNSGNFKIRIKDDYFTRYHHGKQVFHVNGLNF